MCIHVFIHTQEILGDKISSMQSIFKAYLYHKCHYYSDDSVSFASLIHVEIATFCLTSTCYSSKRTSVRCVGFRANVAFGLSIGYNSPQFRPLQLDFIELSRRGSRFGKHPQCKRTKTRGVWPQLGLYMFSRFQFRW